MGRTMVLETYFFASLVLGSIFLIFGLQSDNVNMRWLVLAGGTIFLLSGLMTQTDGIDREVNWNVVRNNFDQNRVQDLNIATQTLLASTDSSVPPAGVRFDSGLWMFAKFLEFVLGWGAILLAVALLATGYWNNYNDMRRRGELVTGQL